MTVPFLQYHDIQIYPMSHPSRAVSQSHVLSTSLPPSQPLHPVTRTRTLNSAHRRCPSSPLETPAVVLTARMPDLSPRSLFTASIQVNLAVGRIPCFQARESPEERLNPARALKFDSWRRQPRAQARYRAGGNTQCWNSATQATDYEGKDMLHRLVFLG